MPRVQFTKLGKLQEQLEEERESLLECEPSRKKRRVETGSDKKQMLQAQIVVIRQEWRRWMMAAWEKFGKRDVEIPICDKTEYVQLYPSNLSDFAFIINGHATPKFISKIPGCSHHIIDKITRGRLIVILKQHY